MNIVLLDLKKEMCKSWYKYFNGENNVTIVNGELENYNIDDIKCLVSPANSYGLMDCGYDNALTSLFGESLQKVVQDYIINNYCGEQLVGSSFIVTIPGTNKKLIHTPTMREPSQIFDYNVVYTAMRSTLICAQKNNVESIIIPAFGRATGQVPCDVVAKEMYKAYVQIFKMSLKVRSWKDVSKRNEIINEYVSKKR